MMVKSHKYLKDIFGCGYFKFNNQFFHIREENVLMVKKGLIHIFTDLYILQIPDFKRITQLEFNSAVSDIMIDMNIINISEYENTKI